MRKTGFTLIVLLLCLLAVSVTSEARGAILQEESILVRLAGSWSGEGQHLGKKAILQMKWERVLDGKFARLSLRVEPNSTDAGSQAFEGHAYYSPSEARRYTGRWFDSQGNAFPINAQQGGDALIAMWGEPGKEEGRSTYRLLDAG